MGTNSSTDHDDGGSGGPALAKKTVEQNLRRPVHYYILVDFSGFRQTVDELNGIDIEVPKAIDGPLYPDDNYGYKRIHIPVGRAHMDGEMVQSNMLPSLQSMWGTVQTDMTPQDVIALAQLALKVKTENTKSADTPRECDVSPTKRRQLGTRAVMRSTDLLRAVGVFADCRKG